MNVTKESELTTAQFTTAITDHMYSYTVSSESRLVNSKLLSAIRKSSGVFWHLN